jgi:two-component system, cell cycle sensor histidine kinase and response regulator CckA
MGTPLRVLIIEDSEDDTLLIMHELKRGGYDPKYERVETAGAMNDALNQQEWDLVISDHSMPHFNSFNALDVLKKRGLDLPFFLVSGTIDEERAVSAMKAGVHDYIMKGNLPRLVPAIQRELREAEMRRKRKEAEEALRSSEEKYRTILENIEDGYYEVDIAGNFTFFNDSMCRIYGYPREELMGMNNRQYTDQENAKKSFKAFNRVYRTGESTKEFDWEIIRKDGTKRCIETSVCLMKDSSGNRIGCRGIVLDITERKRAEEEREKMQAQLIQAQKMESIGTLAGGVAHDFNNLLTTIQGYAQLALMSLKESDPFYENFKEIQQASVRAAKLTRQLLLFSRQQPMDLHPIVLNEIVDNLMKMLKRLIGEDITVQTDLDPNLWTNMADSGNMEQVIMNLVMNAKDAMSEGKNITIKTENVDIDKDYCEINIYARPGKFTCLSVEDTGVGMDKEIIQHIFEPFFTTKEVGKGTGIGLSVVYGIVKQHEGWINVYSEPGRGSVFKVYLPASSVESKDATKGEVISIQDCHGKGERILLVEDDDGIREFAKRVLVESGYVGFEAANAEEALNIFKRENGNFHLVFSDVVLPEKSGLQLVEQLLLRKPELKVLLTSGYTDQKSQWPVICEKGYRFIQKPYGLTDLLRVVREVIEK